MCFMCWFYLITLSKEASIETLFHLHFHLLLPVALSQHVMAIVSCLFEHFSIIKINCYLFKFAESIRVVPNFEDFGKHLVKRYYQSHSTSFQAFHSQVKTPQTIHFDEE